MNPSTAIALAVTLWVILIDVFLSLSRFETFSQRIRYHGKRWWFRAFIALNMINLYMHWFYQEVWFW